MLLLLLLWRKAAEVPLVSLMLSPPRPPLGAPEPQQRIVAAAVAAAIAGIASHTGAATVLGATVLIRTAIRIPRREARRGSEIAKTAAAATAC